MAFQSSVLRDGQWVTETVNIQDALKASIAPKATPSAPRPEPPKCGVVSRTLIESPVVNRIYPVRIRSESHNDIAFVGDHFVQISELRADGQVHEVIRKNDFGHRIRNAIVFGMSFPESLPNDKLSKAEDHDDNDTGLMKAEGDDNDTGLMKAEDPDVMMQDSPPFLGSQRLELLPPQLLVLILETGDAVFLFVRERYDGRLEFVTVRSTSIRNLKVLGLHLSIDPTSRYMAAGTFEEGFVVYEMETLDELNRQYLQHGTFDPVKCTHVRSVNGVIHKMQFLYARPEDDYQIILVLIIVAWDQVLRQNVSRLVTYEWEAGDSLEKVFVKPKAGTRLPDEHRIPLLLIPLRFSTTFFVVSQHSIGIVKCALSGPPQFELLRTDTPAMTRLHIGKQAPLWTAWARPIRREEYFHKTDIIYLGREDGVIMHLEIGVRDLLPSVTNVGSVDINISPAFSAAFDPFTDVLIISGDSGMGGIWKVAPRCDAEQVATIPNWSPVVDLATTDVIDSWTPPSSTVPGQGSSVQGAQTTSLQRPDRIFCTSGRGPKSSLTELRLGVQARIGLDIDVEQYVRQSWMFPTEVQGEKGFYAILALPNATEVVHFSEDFTQVHEMSPEAPPFDLESRTISAIQLEGGTIVQVTEQSVNLIAISQSSRHYHGQVCGTGQLTADSAALKDDAIVLSIHDGQQQSLHVLRIDQMSISEVHFWTTMEAINCLTLFSLGGETFVATGSKRDGLPCLYIYTLDGREVVNKTVRDTNDLGDTDTDFELEVFTTICALTNEESGVEIICGTRTGHLVTVKVPLEGPELISTTVERLGIGPSSVFPASGSFNGNAAIFACCDNNALIMTDFCHRANHFKAKYSVWPTDAKDSSMPAPLINSMYCLSDCISGYPGHMSLMLLSGSRILLTDVLPYVGPVPRCIPLEGTPSRVLFSQTWGCLVVAHTLDDCSTLSFVEPESGLIISTPCDSNREETPFASGLGKPGDRVLGLHEWRYVKDGQVFAFIIVTTKDGSLMIISVQVSENQGRDGSARQIKYWTRYKKKGFQEAVNSVVGKGADLVYCVGKTLHWEVLDLVEKKLVAMKEYILDSEATSLRMADGKVYALTTEHSLQVVNLRAGKQGNDISKTPMDEFTRFTAHEIEMGDSVDKPGEWPISLLGDVEYNIAGVWAPWGKRDGRFTTVFDGHLSASIRRFRRGHTRPLWARSGGQRKYNSLLSTTDGAEVVGVAVDGSLYHFSLIGLDLWRFLRLVQSLAHHSEAICPLTHRPVPASEDWQLESQPHQIVMQIDGDLLQRCLDRRALESLTKIGDGAGLVLFCEYLDALDGGVYTEGLKDGSEDGEKGYFELAYSILEYLLGPVL